MYQVSPPCIAWFASLRSEEVGKSAWEHFLLMVVMETMEYTCAQSFTSMRTIVGKFDKGRSDFKGAKKKFFFPNLYILSVFLQVFDQEYLLVFFIFFVSAEL